MSNKHNITVTICNKTGLHARPAASIVSMSSKFDSEIKIYKDNMEVNAKSIMGVLMLAASKGTELFIEAIGDDAQSAVEALRELIESGFSEE